MHSFLCKKRGDIQNHAILLCCLLLGFGMDAYVCIGKDVKDCQRVWVLVRKGNGKVVFIESITGARYVHGSEKHRFKTISCLFNHENYYANIQKSESIADSKFDLRNEDHWKAMSNMKLSLMKKCPPVVLCPPTIDPQALSIHTEKSLKILIQDYRKNLGLKTIWEDQMGYILSSALLSYEYERISSVTAKNSINMEDFDECIQRSVPDGHTFKGFPIQFNHASSKRMMNALLRDKMCLDIFETTGDLVRFGIVVKIFAYPEDAMAVWVMVAVKYQAVQK